MIVDIGGLGIVAEKEVWGGRRVVGNGLMCNMEELCAGCSLRKDGGKKLKGY